MNLQSAVGIVTTAGGVPAANGELRQRAEELVRGPRPAAGAPTRCPGDRRVEAFLNAYFGDFTGAAPLRLPEALVLGHYGVARELSLPADADTYSNEYLTSYRVRNGVLHNPRSDRRTTSGTFHVCEGGLPIAGDKKAVPRGTFVALFQNALTPPAELLAVPYAARRPDPVGAFFSLLLRPIVCPGVPGVGPEKTMEVRFFAPGGLVSNLDFVESIFGNAGDPHRPENDAGLDAEHWTGHTGCVVLAPHLTRLTKRAVGLPEWAHATARQRRDGMCWRDPAECYNDGQAFKVTCRDARGVIVTLIADNYYGYCKKEVKTQISYAANLFGDVEEEHAGGALAFARYNLGLSFDATDFYASERSVADLARQDPDTIELRPEGHGVDRHCPHLVYIPPDARADLTRVQLWWKHGGREQTIPLRPGTTYMTPSGYNVQAEKHPSTGVWRLMGTVAQGLFCHKPCTVSGGGKSEISKSLADYIQYGPVFVTDLEQDLELVQRLLEHDYAGRWNPGRGPDYAARPSRPLLSPERSLGSVIQLLTPSDDYTAEYNAWLASLPDRIFPLVYLIKRYLPPEDTGNWRDFVQVDSINGRPGHELKALGRRLVGSFLRVGLLASHGWRTFKLRQDFAPAVKIQTEDDITASVVVPRARLRYCAGGPRGAADKFAVNCEYRLFQRPDDAVHRGLDRQTEADLARADNFLSNFEPLSAAQAGGLAERFTDFDAFTAPMRDLLRGAAAGAGYVVCSANPRLVDGQPSKNPRYLQIRPDLLAPQVRYIAERGMRLAGGLSSRDPLPVPVGAVLIGRRNNPPDRGAGIRPLAVYGPIHYQELPELFMDLICSLTGKSPSTTGAGSEGALTKGPFNALRTIVDLNAALVSCILTGLAGFSTAAGYVGPARRVDHDISLLIPEVWCRLTPAERDPAFLIAGGYLEPLRDFDHAGRKVLASRLGYRVTAKFARKFLGRVFDHPDRVFDETYLRPETQDLEAFVDGVANITEAQQRVALQAFEDGSVEQACPPLRALLAIMAHGTFEGKDAHDPEIRQRFTLEALRESDWYRERLRAKQRVDERLWRRHVTTLDAWLGENAATGGALAAEMRQRRQYAAGELERVSAPAYPGGLYGTLGVEPTLYQ